MFGLKLNNYSSVIVLPMQAANTKHLHNIYTTSTQRYVGPTLYQCYTNVLCLLGRYHEPHSGGPRVVVSTAAFHARVRGSVPGLGGLKETKMFLPHPRVKVSIVGSLRDRGVACSASDRQVRISNPVSGRQCHFNHLTILRRFSWPSLAYMCTKVA